MRVVGIGRMGGCGKRELSQVLRPNHLSNCVNMRDGFSRYGLLCIDRKTGERVAKQAIGRPAGR